MSKYTPFLGLEGFGSSDTNISFSFQALFIPFWKESPCTINSFSGDSFFHPAGVLPVRCGAV
jgi:hypothetical protein